MVATNLRKQRSFTLIEIVVAIAILGISFSFFGVKIYRLIEDHQRKLAFHRVIEELKFVQALAVNYQSDVKITLKNNDLGLIIAKDSHEITNPPRRLFAVQNAIKNMALDRNKEIEIQVDELGWMQKSKVPVRYKNKPYYIHISQNYIHYSPR